MGRNTGAKNKPKAFTKIKEGLDEALEIAKGNAEPTKKRVVKIDYDRQAALEEESDMLHIPRELIPDGMRYNWKTLSVLGQQQSRRYGRYQATGWEPVP